MPKVNKSSKLNRVARREAASGPLTTTTPPSSKEVKEEEQADATNQDMSRGQRKRQAKRDTFLKREKLILSTLKLKSEEEQKKRIDGLDAIREALLNTTKNAKTGDPAAQDTSQVQAAATTNKAKKQLMIKEVEHFNLVLQHPAYQQDPFATMQEHLRNTLAKQKEQQQVQSKERTKEEQTKLETQKKLKKEQLKGKKKPRKKFKAARSKG
jgi:hypothetical protein